MPCITCYSFGEIVNVYFEIFLGIMDIRFVCTCSHTFSYLCVRVSRIMGRVRAKMHTRDEYTYKSFVNASSIVYNPLSVIVSDTECHSKNELLLNKKNISKILTLRGLSAETMPKALNSAFYYLSISSSNGPQNLKNIYGQIGAFEILRT